MQKRFLNPTAIGGYGTIILTLVIFFVQGGFGKMTPVTYLYIIGLVVGIGLIVYGLIKANSDKEKLQKQGLNTIVPTLEKMDSLLREQALKESKEPINLQEYTEFNTKINAEIFGFKPLENLTPEIMRRVAQRETVRLAKEYSNKEEWFQRSKTLSGALDLNGYGFKNYRGRGQYKKLMRMLTTNRNYVTDELLNTLINQHIVYSETLNNMLLVKERAVSLKADYQTKQYSIKDFVNSAVMGGLGNFERDISERMIATRTNIGKRIKELEIEKG